MKFSELHNPAAAAEAWKAFERRFKEKVCLSPTKDCVGPIVAAHTLSVAGMLKPISQNGRVFAIKSDSFAYPEADPMQLALRGVRETSVFNGFCEKHDNELFAPIENVPFVCSYEQIFLHAFRAVARECYMKRRQAKSFVSMDTYRKMHGIADDETVEFSPEAKIVQAASLRGAEEIERTKEAMDNYYTEKAWNRLKTTVIQFQKQPQIVANFLCAPSFDFGGNYLQDYTNFEIDLGKLIVTVIPTLTGGFALLSYLDTANNAPQRLIDSLLSQDNITTGLVAIIASESENFAISPLWLDSLSNDMREQFMELFRSNVDPFDASFNRLRHHKIVTDDWVVKQHFVI